MKTSSNLSHPPAKPVPVRKKTATHWFQWLANGVILLFRVASKGALAARDHFLSYPTPIDPQNSIVATASEKTKSLSEKDSFSEEIASFWMRKYIETGIPELASPDLTDFQRVSLLREWAFQNVLVGSPGQKLDQAIPEVRNESAPSIFYRLFLKSDGGFYCGGDAKSLVRLYEMYGYRALTYNMGKEYFCGKKTKGTHVVTLVNITHDGKSVLSIQDSTYNYSLMEESGQPLDFNELINLLIAGSLGSVIMLKGKASHRWKILDKSKNISELKSSDRLLPDGRSMVYREYDFQNLGRGKLYDRYCWWLKILTGNDNPLNLFLFPYSKLPDPQIIDSVQKALSHTQKLEAQARLQN